MSRLSVGTGFRSGGSGIAAAVCLAAVLGLLGFLPLHGQTPGDASLPPEKMVYPPAKVCLLDVRGDTLEYPFRIDDFETDLLSWLRSASYLTVKTESGIQEVLQRNRAAVPEVYDTGELVRICHLADCDYIVFLRLISSEMDLMDGFTVPVLFHRNKVTFRVVVDVAVVEAKTGSLQYTHRVEGKGSERKGVQIYPVTEDPSLFLDFTSKERLARLTMQNLARGTFEAVIAGIHNQLGVKYICYWQNEVHIIADKPGLCPICGSRLVKIMR
jgi:hypothetical protein